MDPGTYTMQFPTDDFFYIGGDISPGKATLIKCDAPSGIDIRKGFGLSGASTVPTGEEPSDVEFLIELWDERFHPQQFETFARKWLTRPVKCPKLLPGQSQAEALALRIRHTGLNRAPFNVDKVLRHNVIHEGQDEYGLWRYRVSFLQFRLPFIAASKPLAAIPGVKNPRPTALTANQKKTQELSDERDRIQGS